jgi:hypothetical protein
VLGSDLVDSETLLILFGLGYLLSKYRQASKVVGELRTGESELYSPYTQRYFLKHYGLNRFGYTLRDRIRFLDLGEY